MKKRQVFFMRHIVCIKNTPDYFLPVEPVASQVYLHQFINEMQGFVMVALVDGEVAGVLLTKIEKHVETFFAVKEYAQIYDIAVAEAFRKHGVGRKMHEVLLSRLHKKGIHRVELEVYHFNHSAEKFYEKLGYKESSKILILDN